MKNKLELPNYYSIITANVRYNRKLNDRQIVLFAEITSMVNVRGYCYATNAYLSQLRNVSKSTTSKDISKLKAEKLIKIVIIYKKDMNNKITKEVKERRIYLVSNESIGIRSNDERVSSNQNKGIRPDSKVNITSNNNTSNNNINDFIDDFFKD